MSSQHLQKIRFIQSVTGLRVWRENNLQALQLSAALGLVLGLMLQSFFWPQCYLSEGDAVEHTKRKVIHPQ